MTFELFRQTLYHLRQHKLRSTMVIFGIAWGTLSVVLLMSLSTSFQKQAMSRIDSALGPNVQGFGIYNTTEPYHGYPANRPVHLKLDTVMDLPNKIPQIGSITPMTFAFASLSFGNAPPLMSVVKGVSADAAKLFNLQFNPNNGGFFTPLSVARGEYVVVIDPTTATAFFKNQNPIGQTLFIKGTPFRIAGVTSKKGDTSRFNGKTANATIYIPYTTFQQLWGDHESVFNLVSPKDPTQAATMKQAISSSLAVTLDIPPKDAQNMFPNWDSFREMTNALFIKLKTFFSLSGALALLIGGLGVANILFLMVAQRSREIGLTMALGAQDKHILSQILLESFLLVGLGGLLGFILSWVSVAILQNIPESLFGKPSLPPMVLLLTVGVLALLGLLSGYFPARKAMRLNPVEAFNKVS